MNVLFCFVSLLFCLELNASPKTVTFDLSDLDNRTHNKIEKYFSKFYTSRMSCDVKNKTLTRRVDKTKQKINEKERWKC